MGLGPASLALYRQMKILGLFDQVKEVLELGAQQVWARPGNLIHELYKEFGASGPSADFLTRLPSNQVSGRELYTDLGMNYTCVDVEPSFGAINLDLNFDDVPAEHRNRYDFVTNHGTSEHIFDQARVFRAMHDFTRPGGMMLHALAFTVHLEHGFFNYQPNLFEALGRYNSYKTLGVWVGLDWTLSSLVPWEPNLLEFLVLNEKTTTLLVTLQQKTVDQPFCPPFQGVYQDMIPDEPLSRYNLVVDGSILNALQFRQLNRPAPGLANATPTADAPAPGRTLDQACGRELLRELAIRLRRRAGLGS